MTNRILLIIFISFYFFSLVHAQDSKQTVFTLLKGTLVDELTDAPIEAEIEIRDKDAKKIKIKSNSIDGSFEQVLNPGETYYIIFNNYEIIRKIDTITLPMSTKYSEHKQKFQVKKLSIGQTIFSINCFDINSSVPNIKLKQLLEELANIMTFNRTVKFEFVVNACDTYYKTKEIKEETIPQKKKSKSKQTTKKEIITEPDINSVKLLVDNRITELNKMVSSISRFNNRVTIKPDYSAGELVDETNLNTNTFNFKITVSELEQIFKNTK